MSTDKTTTPSDKDKIIDDVYEEYKEQKHLITTPQVGTALEKIEEQLTSLVDRQKNGVSAEFNALMDGYVNKANESQEYKVKATHFESVYEELKTETKTLKEENKKFKTDLEATQEALRMSESDIKRLKNEAETYEKNHQEQVAGLVEEREVLKQRLKEVQIQNDQNLQNYNAVKSELLEQKYKLKQIEQERQVEEESQKR